MIIHRRKTLYMLGQPQLQLSSGLRCWSHALRNGPDKMGQALKNDSPFDLFRIYIQTFLNTN